MPWVGFEPTIQAFEPAKTVHALDRAATVIGKENNISPIFLQLLGLLNRLIRLFKPAPMIDWCIHVSN
jgi:hypothetical protein